MIFINLSFKNSVTIFKFTRIHLHKFDEHVFCKQKKWRNYSDEQINSHLIILIDTPYHLHIIANK